MAPSSQPKKTAREMLRDMDAIMRGPVQFQTWCRKAKVSKHADRYTISVMDTRKAGQVAEINACHAVSDNSKGLELQQATADAVAALPVLLTLLNELARNCASYESTLKAHGYVFDEEEEI